MPRGGPLRVRPALVPVVLALCVAGSPALAREGRSATPGGLLADSVAAILSGETGQARWGVLAVSLTRGDTLICLEASRRFIPASNVKLFTTGAFLLREGNRPGAPTDLLARGTVRRRTRVGSEEVRLKGDLLLKASGLPDIYQLLAPGSRGLLDSLAALLHESGLRGFEGTLWIDGSRLASEPYGPGWAIDDLPMSYGAPLNAVLANGNAATVIAAATRGGVTLRLEPPEVPLTLAGAVAVGAVGSSPRLLVAREPGSRVLRVSGSVPPGESIRRQVAVPEPDSTAGLVFLGALRRAGIEVKAGVRVAPAQTAFDPSWTPDARGWDGLRRRNQVSVVASLAPPPPAAIASMVNGYSLNAEAEALLRSLDPAPSGKSAAAALRMLRQTLSSAGVDTLDISLVDGSGLSPLNLATPRAIVSWLTFLERDSTLAVPFSETLAAPGGVGTLERRMNGLGEEAALRGKSGTLTNVSAFSGFVRTRGGERVAFSALSNGNRGSVAAARRAEERLVALLAGFVRPAPVSPRAPVGIPR